MSQRGLQFARSWIAANVDLEADYPYMSKRARLLASACQADALARHIGLQEIEDETGDLEEAIGRMLQSKRLLL